MKPKDGDGQVYRFQISGDLDRPALEALHLELRRLAARHGVEVAEFRVEQAEDAASA